MSTHTTTSSSTTTREASTDEDDHDGDDQDHDPEDTTLVHTDEAPRSDEIDRDVPLSADWRTVYKAMDVETEEGGR